MPDRGRSVFNGETPRRRGSGCLQQHVFKLDLAFGVLTQSPEEVDERCFGRFVDQLRAACLHAITPNAIVVRISEPREGVGVAGADELGKRGRVSRETFRLSWDDLLVGKPLARRRIVAQIGIRCLG